MRQGLVNDWPYVGACLANSDSKEQVEFFKAFIKECLSWGTRYQIEQQIAHINLDLTPDERRVLAMLGFDENNA